jgi:hypothetical protein
MLGTVECRDVWGLGQVTLLPPTVCRGLPVRLAEEGIAELAVYSSELVLAGEGFEQEQVVNNTQAGDFVVDDLLCRGPYKESE